MMCCSRQVLFPYKPSRKIQHDFRDTKNILINAQKSYKSTAFCLCSSDAKQYGVFVKIYNMFKKYPHSVIY